MTNFTTKLLFIFLLGDLCVNILGDVEVLCNTSIPASICRFDPIEIEIISLCFSQGITSYYHVPANKTHEQLQEEYLKSAYVSIIVESGGITQYSNIPLHNLKSDSTHHLSESWSSKPSPNAYLQSVHGLTCSKSVFLECNLKISSIVLRSNPLIDIEFSEPTNTPIMLNFEDLMREFNIYPPFSANQPVIPTWTNSSTLQLEITEEYRETLIAAHNSGSVIFDIAPSPHCTPRSWITTFRFATPGLYNITPPVGNSTIIQVTDCSQTIIQPTAPSCNDYELISEIGILSFSSFSFNFLPPAVRITCAWLMTSERYRMIKPWIWHFVCFSHHHLNDNNMNMIQINSTKVNYRLDEYKRGVWMTSLMVFRHHVNDNCLLDLYYHSSNNNHHLNDDVMTSFNLAVTSDLNPFNHPPSSTLRDDNNELSFIKLKLFGDESFLSEPSTDESSLASSDYKSSLASLSSSGNYQATFLLSMLSLTHLDVVDDVDVVDDDDVQLDDIVAIGLLHLSAAVGHPPSILALSHHYHVSSDDVTSCHYSLLLTEISMNWYNNIEPNLQFNLLSSADDSTGHIGETGIDDDVTQLRMLQASEGHVPSMLTLGDNYYYGSHGLVQSYDSAYRYFGQAANAGSVEGMTTLASMNLKGLGTMDNHKNASEAFRLYNLVMKRSEEEAIGSLSAKALNGLGYMYFYGEEGLLERNQTMAFDYFSRAAVYLDVIRGDTLFNLGYCLYHGIGVDANVSRAFEYFDSGFRIFGHFQSGIYAGRILMSGNRPEDEHKSIQHTSRLASEYLYPSSKIGPWGDCCRSAYDTYMSPLPVVYALNKYLIASVLGYSVAGRNVGYIMDRYRQDVKGYYNHDKLDDIEYSTHVRLLLLEEGHDNKRSMSVYKLLPFFQTNHTSGVLNTSTINWLLQQRRGHLNVVNVILGLLYQCDACMDHDSSSQSLLFDHEDCEMSLLLLSQKSENVDDEDAINQVHSLGLSWLEFKLFLIRHMTDNTMDDRRACSTAIMRKLGRFGDMFRRVNLDVIQLLLGLKSRDGSVVLWLIGLVTRSSGVWLGLLAVYWIARRFR